MKIQHGQSCRANRVRCKCSLRTTKAPSHTRRKLMSSLLAVPIRQDDQVQVVHGHYKGEGRLTVHVSIYTSKEAITKLKLEKDRRKILEHKEAVEKMQEY
uniref:60S ribosomal protein L26 n=1 Tax=Oryzias melastigma TaxID=30732 RepID=A0A3B3CAR0_ORYME